jgi:AcrR family transcriptional regulator
MPARTEVKRADARQNREVILAVALDMLTESADVSLNAIAKGAGIANATLYRHFATREALILEVYRHEVHQLVNAADEFLAERSAADALRAWIERLAQYAMTKHGLSDALRTATRSDNELFAETYGPMVGALGKLLVAAGESGAVRGGLDPEDVLLAFGGLWQLNPAGDWQAQARRLYDLVLAGIAAPA